MKNPANTPDALQPWHDAQPFVNAALGRENLQALHAWVDDVLPLFQQDRQGSKP